MHILTAQEAMAYVKQLYGSESTIDVIDTGYENIIFVVNNEYSVRFPRTLEIWNRGIVERTVLAMLTNGPIPIPEIISTSDNPAHVVTKYIHGKPVSAENIRSLPVAVKANIGASIAEFAYFLHDTVDVSTIKTLLPEQKDTYGDYLKRVLIDRVDPDAKIDALAKKYYELWVEMPKKKEVVVHDDLHTGNLLFDDKYNLVGVLDFGAICIGSPEQDLRQTYRLGDNVLNAAANKYKALSGRDIDIEIAKIWTITQELGAYCREESGIARERAKQNLEFWFGI